MKFLFTALFLGFSTTVFAQQGFLFEQNNAVKIVIGADTLMHGWAGGLNSPVISKIDLNQDGVEDLYIFDRETDRNTTYLADNSLGTWQWQYAPQYENLFPDKLKNWVLLRDFDNDGKKDLFTVIEWGLEYYLVVFRNNTPLNGVLTFGAPRFLWNTSVSPATEIKISPDVLPAITDLDNDGDLDVLFFGGSKMHDLLHFRNLSQDILGRADSLSFSQAPQNWGGLSRCSSGVCNSFAFQNSVSCRTNGINHFGSGNVLALDLDNDGDKDLLIGEDMCNNLVRITNSGSVSAAAFTQAGLQAGFPQNTTPAVLENYLAAFYEDLNFDGKKDLLISPFVKFNRTDDVNMHETAWFYQNNAATASVAPVFSFRKRNFLQDQMVELGESARPVFVDIDADGDQDLLIGNYGGSHSAAQAATVSLFENIGTASQPIFKLTDPDYLNFSADKLLDLKLQFADMDGDGSPDLILQQTQGNNTQLFYFPNTAQANQPFQFSKATKTPILVDLISGESTFFYDLDHDGDLDLLVGTAASTHVDTLRGALVYYQRIGANPNSYQSWKLENKNLGNIPLDMEHAALQPFITDLNNDGKPDLATVTNSGRLEVYSDILQDLTATFQPYSHTLFNRQRNTYEASRFGLTLYAAFTDLDGDQLPEAVIGTRAGGLVFLQNHSTVKLGVKDQFTSEIKLKIFPNPATEMVNITSEEAVQVSVFDATGREINLKTNSFSKTHQLNVSGLKPGIYFLKMATRDFRTFGRSLVINR